MTIMMSIWALTSRLSVARIFLLALTGSIAAALGVAWGFSNTCSISRGPRGIQMIVDLKYSRIVRVSSLSEIVTPQDEQLVVQLVLDPPRDYFLFGINVACISTFRSNLNGPQGVFQPDRRMIDVLLDFPGLQDSIVVDLNDDGRSLSINDLRCLFTSGVLNKCESIRWDNIGAALVTGVSVAFVVTLLGLFTLAQLGDLKKIARRSSGLCMHCGYPTKAGTCPECGKNPPA